MDQQDAGETCLTCTHFHKVMGPMVTSHGGGVSRIPGWGWCQLDPSVAPVDKQRSTNDTCDHYEAAKP